MPDITLRGMEGNGAFTPCNIGRRNLSQLTGDQVTTPSADAVLDELREIMIDVFDVDDLEITPATSADDIEEWDSLSHVRLLVAVERKFKFKFSNSEIESMKSVSDLLRLVQNKAS